MGKLFRVLVAGVATVWLGVALGQGNRFAARLSTVPIDPGTRAEITGRGAVSAVLSGRDLSLDGSFEGLQSPAELAELHIGARIGVRGPAFAKLELTGDVSGAISGTVELSREQVAALREGRLYVQIHSENAPDGNLWGWLLQ